VLLLCLNSSALGHLQQQQLLLHQPCNGSQ
jgi:hypothetical protein